MELMNKQFPPSVFHDHLEKRNRAIDNTAAAKMLLDGAIQSYPDTIPHQSLSCSFEDMRGFAVVFTAGGEGERLRLSLIDRGVSPELLRDFTKATYPLKNFHDDYGALQINLAMINHIGGKHGIDIPVIVTTGPKSSITHRVIQAILEKHGNFGLPHIKIIPQDERLHFTDDGKIAVCLTNDNQPYPVTQPDETGGPLMKLKQKIGTNDSSSTLDWLAGLGCEKLLIVQGTAIYEPNMLSYMAAAAKNHDCVGVGIPRNSFDAKDPFGTFVQIEKESRRMTCIIEQDVRNDETRSIVNRDTSEYLPFNTGFYAVDRSLIENNDFPDYATSPKELLPGFPKSPKAGYAATSILPLAKHPLILTVNSDMFAVIKTAEDLETMTATALRFGLREMV